jgi:RNA polymerase sigma-70 factor (ECF subfamily)
MSRFVAVGEIGGLIVPSTADPPRIRMRSSSYPRATRGLVNTPPHPAAESPEPRNVSGRRAYAPRMEKADFHALYERHSRDVYRFAFYLCGNRAQAEDLAADAFAKAWSSVDAVRMATVKGYLFAIVRNLAQQSFRREARRKAGGEDTHAFPSDPRPGPLSSASDRGELRAVLEALARLPETDRAALLMRAQGGLSYEEIAMALGLSTVAVRVKVHRARLGLAQLTAQQEQRP